MCRYSMTIYKPHYACFECRKTFKRILLKDIKKGAINTYEAKCPQCGQLTADMGLDFKSPRKNDLKSWEHMKNLFAVGVTFHSCGCSGPGYIPKTGEQLLEYLKRKRHDYVKNLGFWLNRNAPTTKQEIQKDLKETVAYRGGIPYSLKEKKGYVKPETAIVYWNNRLAELENRIQQLSNYNQ